MGKNSSNDGTGPVVGALFESPLARSYLNFVGRQILRFSETVHGLGAFALITLGVALTKFNRANRVIHPLIGSQIFQAGVRLLPMVSFLALALGFMIIGQAVVLASRLGVQAFIGPVMVTVVVRELGPLVAASLALARVGTMTVIQLGTARAQGEVEALEALGVDPILYLVVPRVFGLAISIFALTVYLIIIALFSGYLFVFLHNVPLRLGDYFRQLAEALKWEDFVLLALKTVLFGTVIAVVSCYQGLARPLHVEEVGEATMRAVVHSVVFCVLIDALFIVFYLLI